MEKHHAPYTIWAMNAREPMSSLECCMSRLSVFMSSLCIPPCIRGKGLIPCHALECFGGHNLDGGTWRSGRGVMARGIEGTWTNSEDLSPTGIKQQKGHPTCTSKIKNGTLDSFHFAHQCKHLRSLQHITCVASPTRSPPAQQGIFPRLRMKGGSSKSISHLKTLQGLSCEILSFGTLSFPFTETLGNQRFSSGSPKNVIRHPNGNDYIIGEHLKVGVSPKNPGMS